MVREVRRTEERRAHVACRAKWSCQHSVTVSVTVSLLRRVEMLRILRSCFTVVVLSYGIYYTFIEIFYNCIPYGILCIFCLYFFLHVVRVPAPDVKALEAIIGEDLSSELENPDNNLFLLKTVAHRGAALDAPENSLAAFNMVTLV